MQFKVETKSSFLEEACLIKKQSRLLEQVKVFLLIANTMHILLRVQLAMGIDPSIILRTKEVAVRDIFGIIMYAQGENEMQRREDIFSFYGEFSV